jgi:hypothetical protein
VVPALPDLPEPTVNPVLPDLTEQRVPPVLRALMASPAQMELLVEAALLEPRVLQARPVPRELRVGPETASVFAPEFTGTFSKNERKNR